VAVLWQYILCNVVNALRPFIINVLSSTDKSFDM